MVRGEERLDLDLRRLVRLGRALVPLPLLPESTGPYLCEFVVVKARDAFTLDDDYVVEIVVSPVGVKLVDPVRTAALVLLSGSLTMNF